MTRETKKKLLINALDFKEIVYIKYDVYESNEFINTYDTEKEARNCVLKLNDNWHQYSILPVNHTISKEDLIDIILDTLF